MPWEPTNANDVTLIVRTVTRDASGTRTGSSTQLDTARITVDEFSIETEEDLSRLSGVGNANAIGISQGDVEHGFSFTVQGEDAELFQSLAGSDGRANELEIVARGQLNRTKLTGAYAGTRNLSGTSGDPIQYEVQGVATDRDDSDNTTA